MDPGKIIFGEYFHFFARDRVFSSLALKKLHLCPGANMALLGLDLKKTLSPETVSRRRAGFALEFEDRLVNFIKERLVYGLVIGKLVCDLY